MWINARERFSIDSESFGVNALPFSNNDSSIRVLKCVAFIFDITLSKIYFVAREMIPIVLYHFILWWLIQQKENGNVTVFFLIITT